MSVNSELTRIRTAVSNAYTQVNNKGGTLPASLVVANLASAIDSISTSKPEQSKTATANGTVYPDSGYALSSVVVNIPTYDGSVT